MGFFADFSAGMKALKVMAGVQAYRQTEKFEEARQQIIYRHKEDEAWNKANPQLLRDASDEKLQENLCGLERHRALFFRLTGLESSESIISATPSGKKKLLGE